MYTSVNSSNCSPPHTVYHRFNGSYGVENSGSMDYDRQINDYDLNQRRPSVRRSLEQTYDFPDFRSAINVKFSSMTPPRSGQKSYEKGFDFGDQYKQIYEEHKKSVNGCSDRQHSPKLQTNGLTNDSHSTIGGKNGVEVSSIWCMDYQENLIVIGCANGSLEFWEGTTGRFKVGPHIFAPNNSKGQFYVFWD